MGYQQLGPEKMLEIIPNHTEITREIYTISRLNQAAKLMLEEGFPLLWITGEISNFSQPSSGHMYFTLKDETAQVRCAMFRFRNSLLNFKARNGLQVLARAKVSMYEGRGEFQLLIEHMEEAGDGRLRLAFEQLKQKLAAQGLFAAEYKKPLPAFSKTIGVVTSPTGAAIRDIISVLQRRMPGIAVVIYPTAVQGSEAAAQIAAAIALANTRKECEVLIVGRGGGSLEDLWPFNEEVVAKAIFASDIPIISAVGHEIDYTIADWVADHRAPTPSVAAEMVSPNTFDLLQLTKGQYQRLCSRFLKLLQQNRQQLNWLSSRLQHPRQRLQARAQELDYLEQRLQRAQQQIQQRQLHRLQQLSIRLQVHNPQNLIKPLLALYINLEQRLQRAMELKLKQVQGNLAVLSGSLHAISPLATLQRGYAIVYRAKDMSVVQDTAMLEVGDKIISQVQAGKIYSSVDKLD
jgi:exodeoxyribonuclease VII large subunit